MVFNWFRRKFDKSESEQVQDSEQVATPAVVEDEPTEPETSEAVATDYLAWAKAAYQNIQQQQESSSVAVVEADETRSDESATVETTAPKLLETAAITDVEPQTTAPEIEVAVDNSAPVRSEAPEATPVVTENIPIWARDDRQQRLEQLKATAIKTLEPEAPTPEIALDDDFLWSAKVLADQGRTPEQVSLDEINWLKKLRQGLDKTRRGFVNQFKALIGQGPLNADAVESIETLLLQADVGVEATDYVIETLQAKLREESLPPEEAVAYLKQILRDLLDKPLQENYTQEFLPIQNQLNIWLLVGVNGVGKTTTIGKLAHMTQASGYKCLIAAGDTFRAAAVQQVQVWGQRSGIEVIANPGQNTDPAAVVYDAISAAQARGTELLLVDTAGRLQNKKNLMDELSKIRRIIDKQATNAQIESLLVLDATLGQNGLRQAQVFAEAAKLSGVVLTKLDGTAKGGVALAVVQQLGLPIRFIGAGEGIEDLRPFSSYEFVEALLSG
ncbi:MAG: signal recognition particle-docking protein FtsY [Chamaesiphon sp.]|nr:signal recognition particle-docking protein FtsY [Chamaesiphon sp.]